MAISTAGVCPSPAWLPDVLAEGRAVLCGFDADDPGDDAARVMTARHPAVGRLRPSGHDWNDQLRARSADPARS
jgi:DNA primase